MAYSGFGIKTYNYAAPSFGPAPDKQDFYSQVQPANPWGGGNPTSTFDYNAYNQAMSDYHTKKNAAFAAAGRNPDGSPMSPEFQTMIDESTGRLRDEYSMAQALQNVAGYDQFQDFATGTGPSEYAQAAEGQLDLKTALLRDQIADEANRQAATMRSNLAMRGGLSSGARERVGYTADRTAQEERQKARQGQLLGFSDILKQDAASRQDALGRFVGMGADAEQYDIGQALNEVGREREFAMQRYTEEGKKWAAEKKAEEQRAAAGSCFGEGTLVKMADGSLKTIKDIDIGDEIEKGGKVYALFKAEADPESLYWYKGMLVVGCHPVLEDGKWLRVMYSEKAERVPETFKVDFVYDLSTENHRIVSAGDVEFTDFAEHDDFYLTAEESIERLNQTV